MKNLGERNIGDLVDEPDVQDADTRASMRLLALLGAPAYGQYEIGYAFGKLALTLAQRFGNRAEECRTLEVYGVLVHHWKAPLRARLPLLKEGFRAGVESGETAFAAFSLNAFLIDALPAGMPLNELREEAAVAQDFAITQKNRTSVEITVAQRQLARALTGATSRPDRFDDAEFVEARFLGGSRHTRNRARSLLGSKTADDLPHGRL